jgi:bifunctional UDP-N-acetylglucosamine pyrophosphorylase/glucosamine-1-phosphate N-acetyltransferase
LSILKEILIFFVQIFFFFAIIVVTGIDRTKGGFPFMNTTGAIVFLPRGAGGELPALLETLLFTPGAVWLAETLKRSGVERFLVVCHGDDQEQAAHCFPEGTAFVTSDTEDANTRLADFLSGSEGKVAVITGAVFLAQEGAQRLFAPAPLPAGEPTGVFRMDAAVLRDALQKGGSFEDVLQSRGEVFGYKAELFEGVFPFGLSWESRERAGALARKLQAARLASGDVRFIDPDHVYIDPAVTVGEGTIILPGTILRGRTVIGKNCEIGPNSMVRDCAVGDNVLINASQCNESVIGSHAKIGPFAYIRPGCTVGADTKVGDFVEVKNSSVGSGSKASHLSYIGDSDVGEDVNIGCGVVFVNYDGKNKHRSVVKDGSFVGCNVNLVSPVVIEEGAYIAAGTTVTHDIPKGALCVGRAKEKNIEGWVARRGLLDKKSK